MEIFITVLLFVVGLAIIIKGGDLFVDAAVWIAETKGIPKIIIGATIVSLATTLPEFFVSNIAVFQGSVEVGIGNAVGSIICNSGLILGISFIAMPNSIKRKDFLPKALLMMICLVTLFLFSIDRVVTPIQGLILLALLVLFIRMNLKEVKQVKMDSIKDKELAIDAISSNESKEESKKMMIKFVIGIIGIVIGAQLLVNNGVSLAELAGIPEQIVAVTLIALGTSLPELVTTITSIAKKEYSMSIGNIVGANILNVTMILGSATLISGEGLTITSQTFAGISNPIPQTLYIDIPIAVIIMLIIILPTALKEKTYKIQGFLMVGVYALYIGFLALNL